MGLPPPDEIPACYYVVLMNFRNTEPETRELVRWVASTFGSITDFKYRQAFDGTVNYYVGYYTVTQSVNCVLFFPRHLAARAVFARIAATDYIFDEPEENEPMATYQHL